MSGYYLLKFAQDENGTLLLPKRCSVLFPCYESEELQQAISCSIEESLYALALSGMDLRALDGVTVAIDARKAACELQGLPDGTAPLEMADHPETMELARTVAVRRGDEFRFHVVLRVGLALMSLSSKPHEQALACGCFAHEAAHVQHEGHLYRTFPGIYGSILECGDRSRQTFLKALDVWSEYAACRSSATYRPEALEDFVRIFCRTFKECRSTAEKWIAHDRDDGRAAERFREIQQAFGDAFISAGYLLGHLHGLELNGLEDAPEARQMLSGHPAVSELTARLGCLLHELWLTESAWQSLEAFAPVYDLLCELIALHGMEFARDGDEWQLVMSNEQSKARRSHNS